MAVAPAVRESRQIMNIVQKHKSFIMGVGLLCLAWGCSAVTLGRAQGAAWIGSPLDLKVQLEFADAQEAAGACLEAEVFHGDLRQDPRRIRVNLEQGTPGSGAVAHITSSAPVDEPMVTVYLKAGCQQKISRRYVLLAELRSDITPPAPAPRVPTPAPVVTPSVPSTPPRPSQVAKPHTPSTSAAIATAAKVTPTRAVTAPRLVKRPDSSGKSRLKLDMLELMEERSPTLKSSDELSALPTEDAQRRAQAAAWWRALNTSPEDRLRDSARVQEMETQVLALQTLTISNQRSLLALGTQLEKAESERYANPLVYALGALLLTMLTALFLLWRQRGAQTAPDSWLGGTGKP